MEITVTQEQNRVPVTVLHVAGKYRFCECRDTAKEGHGNYRWRCQASDF